MDTPKPEILEDLLPAKAPYSYDHPRSLLPSLILADFPVMTGKIRSALADVSVSVASGLIEGAGGGGYEQVYLLSPFFFLFPESLLWDSAAWAAPVPRLLPLTQLYPHDIASS